jgi:hypothetical protein
MSISDGLLEAGVRLGGPGQDVSQEEVSAGNFSRVYKEREIEALASWKQWKEKKAKIK